MSPALPLSIAVASLLAGCMAGLARLADDGFQVRPADYAEESVERFTTFRLDGWTPVSRDSLVVWNGPSEAYLVWDTCRDLQFAERIGITETARSVSRFEKVRVGRDSCPIEDIRRIDVSQYRADRDAARDAQRGR
jgi:Family of unknown function (DUF6491)